MGHHSRYHSAIRYRLAAVFRYPRADHHCTQFVCCGMGHFVDRPVPIFISIDYAGIYYPAIYRLLFRAQSQ